MVISNSKICVRPYLFVPSVAQDTCTPVPKTTTYDYIVVGSGPGGGPLAARLAIAGFSVLLLEAGDDHGDDLTVEIPLLQTASSEYIPQSWQFFVDHYQNSAQAQDDSKFTWRKPDGGFWVGPNPPAGSTPLGIYYPRAGTLGGCAEHNALVATYPHESDWDYVARITGDGSWSANRMRQYWAKFESNQYIPRGTPAANGHGYNGWLNISVTDLNLVAADPKWLSLAAGSASLVGKNIWPSPDPITGETLAKVFTTDVNSAAPGRDRETGIFQIPLSVSLGPRARASPRDFILDTANARNPDGSQKYRLDIQLNTLVTRVLFDNSTVTPRATGVEYMTGCNLYRADPASGEAKQTGAGVFRATREVILSGGVYNTPQLLKLSGIGPRAELRALNIPVVRDSPGVGTNMQDRYEVTVVGKAPETFSALHNCTFLHAPVLDNSLPFTDPCLQQWRTDANDRGIYGTNAVAWGIVYNSSVSSATEADMFIVGVPANFHGYFPEYSLAVNLDHWSWLVLKAHSRNNAGTVTLRSTDPRDMPFAQFNSFRIGGDEDVQAVYEGVQFARKMFQATPDINGTFEEIVPGPSVQTPAQVKQFIRDEAWGHHASCSVPVGAHGDPYAPLDSEFRVQGVNGLRVVDASVFPRIPGFYIVGAVYMLSEKAADVIIKAALEPAPSPSFVDSIKRSIPTHIAGFDLPVWETTPGTVFGYAALATISFSYFVFSRLYK